jgi:hypothetical protein
MENSRQEQTQKYSIGTGEGSSQFSHEKSVAEMTIEEKRDLVARGKVWLEKAKQRSQQK